MANLSIVTNPTEFFEQVVLDTPNSELPEIYEPVIRYFSYYIWRGAFEARRKYLQSRVQSDLGLLCLATYKGFIPIVHLVRLGYPGDALTLLRTTIERIALLGYLVQNTNEIEKYNRGKTLYKKANKWAKNEWNKDETTNQWGYLYGSMSKLAHSNIEATAGHVVADNNAIGKAFRMYMQPGEDKNIDFCEPPLIGLLFGIRTADLFAKKLFDDQKFDLILEDKECLTYLPAKVFEQSVQMFEKWVSEGIQLLAKKN